MHVGQDRLGLRSAQGLGEREDVGLDRAVLLAVDCRVVLVVARIGRHVDVEAGDAASLVDVLPEVLLAGDDLGGEGSEWALGQIGQNTEVDATIVTVDRLRARLLGDTDIEDDALTG